MSFRSPWMLGALVLVPLVIGAYVVARRRRAQRAAALAREGLATASTGAAVGWRRHVPFGLLVAALVVLITALARPMATVSTPRREATVVLAIDVSNSMRATDVQPSRFEAAKTAAKAFVARQPSEVRIGVVAFGAGAVTVQPPTIVHADVDAAINRLSLGGGTSLGQGLISSLDVIAGKQLAIDTRALGNDESSVNIGFYGSATVVVFSDGENLSEPDPVALAGVASSAGVRVDTIGVGTAQGAVVQVDGFSVATALDADLLKQVASTSDGSYHEASDSGALAQISRHIDLHFKLVRQHTEITGVLAAIGVILLLAGAVLSIVWFGRVL